MSESDNLYQVHGVLDVRGDSAFLRADDYRQGPGDTHVPTGLLRRNQLRPGDEITGAARPGQQQKRGSLSRIDTVNGLTVAEALRRPRFEQLTPLHPDRRLTLETRPQLLTTRVIDLVMPVGKGQRALVVSPPKAGKTSVLQSVARAVSANHPECDLMVVLVDERPEEVTDMRRSVDGEVIASTFDRPPAEHITVAELAVERAKRRVEQGRDVVLLLDSITRLGRAYNLAAKASGRILSGGVDSAALHPLKRFLGAARNIEGGGSLTMFATAMVENGSVADTLFFEELKSTGNAELKLDRRIAERRMFPAVDVVASGTRREELLLTREELAITADLRRALQSREQHAVDQLVEQLRRTGSNNEFLLRLRGSSHETAAAA